MKEMLTFNFGVSTILSPGTSVSSCSGRGWPSSAILITTATLASIAIGVLLGIYGGWKRQGAVDQGSMGTSMVLYAMPEFVLGMIFILIFAVGCTGSPSTGTRARYPRPASRIGPT